MNGGRKMLGLILFSESGKGKSPSFRDMTTPSQPSPRTTRDRATAARHVRRHLDRADQPMRPEAVTAMNRLLCCRPQGARVTNLGVGVGSAEREGATSLDALAFGHLWRRPCYAGDADRGSVAGGADRFGIPSGRAPSRSGGSHPGRHGAEVRSDTCDPRQDHSRLRAAGSRPCARLLLGDTHDRNHKIISPIDGSVYAERPVVERCRARRRGVGGARGAGRVAAGERRRARPHRPRLPRGAGRDERRDRHRARLADGPADPLWRREGRRRGAHPRHGGARRGGARPLRPAGEGRLPPLHRPRAARPRPGHRAVELSLPHRRQFDRARRCSPATRCSSSMPRRRCWSASASPQPSRRPGCPPASSATSSCRMPRPSG